MNVLSLQHRRNSRLTNSAGILVIALLALPYLLDVAYYGDFTPTHFAQENLIDENPEALDDKELSIIATDQDEAVVIKVSSPAQRHSSTQHRCSGGDVSPPQYLIAASLISRPPPAS